MCINILASFKNKIQFSNFMPYTSAYESRLLRESTEQRPWNVVDVTRKYVSPSTVLLDVGCATAKKVLPLASDVRMLYGLDINDEMLECAKVNMQNEQQKNVRLVRGSSKRL